MKSYGYVAVLCVVCFSSVLVWGQLTDQTQAPNNAKVGIAKSLRDEVGAGRGDVMTSGSSIYIIERDPFRSIRRGRQLFQRKFTHAQGQGPNEGDGVGDINTDNAIGAGLSDSCALCHGRPKGSAGVGGNVATRPDSRDAPHLFGLGLREMLADEITSDLRNSRSNAIALAAKSGHSISAPLNSKGINYGYITVSSLTIRRIRSDGLECYGWTLLVHVFHESHPPCQLCDELLR